MKNLLFPRNFQIVGWVLFIPTVILAFLLFLNTCDLDWIDETIFNLDWINDTVLNDIIIIGLALGSIFIVCSKEPCEDEMTRSIRLAALLNSLYIYVILLICCTLAINGIEFLKFTLLNLVLFPVIYVVTFRLEMHRYHKMSDNEE